MNNIEKGYNLLLKYKEKFYFEKIQDIMIYKILVD